MLDPPPTSVSIAGPLAAEHSGTAKVTHRNRMPDSYTCLLEDFSGPCELGGDDDDFRLTPMFFCISPA